MSEVFSGKPDIVSVSMRDGEGHLIEYHVAGRDLKDVAEAVKEIFVHWYTPLVGKSPLGLS